MNRLKNTMNNNKGFTLIELIAVMIIIASICAIVLPNSGKILTNIKKTSTIRQICAILNYAREQAVIRGTDYQVNFNLEKKSCWITKKENDTFILLKGNEGKTFLIPREFSFQTTTKAITLYPKGNSSGGEIYIENFQIVVDEITGMVEVLRVKNQIRNLKLEIREREET